MLRFHGLDGGPWAMYCLAHIYKETIPIPLPHQGLCTHRFIVHYPSNFITLPLIRNGHALVPHPV